MSREIKELRQWIQRRIAQCVVEIAALRRQANPKREDMEALAERLGRKLRKGMGKEPRY